ncbi:unnamed protein product [Echinostoma caproni]|uniref:Transposase n=1 Tax=Echinostoma caproni TaxID=27848 RepID=A0A183AXB7_9TREM|nr:unnamed protein product [Echinostoma caproni]
MTYEGVRVLRIVTHESFKPTSQCLAAADKDHRLSDPAVRARYESELVRELNAPQLDNVDEQWDQISRAMHSAAKVACESELQARWRHWISQESAALMEKKRPIPTRQRSTSAPEEPQEGP